MSRDTQGGPLPVNAAPFAGFATRIGPFLIPVTAGRTVTVAAGAAADAADERFLLDFPTTPIST
jgi:hypothetical protein